MEKIEYNIDKTDEELRYLISKMQNSLSDEGFSDFCNIVMSRSSKCWQSGLEEYPFGEKNYSPWQSKKTILEILELEKITSSYDRNYKLYLKEAICIYHKLYSREMKLKRVLKIKN